MSLAALTCAIQQHQHHYHQHRNLSQDSKPQTDQNMMTVPLEAPVPYYASGSLPRITNKQRRPTSRNSMSLSRSNSARNSWATTVNRLTQVPPPAVAPSKISPQSSIAPSDSISVNNRHLLGYTGSGGSVVDPNTKNKYNTLTPAEAKKLNRFIHARPPARTASVLHKPRPPPLVVTNLDELGIKPLAPQPPVPLAVLQTNAARSASSCSNHSSHCGQRNSINFGQHCNNRHEFSTTGDNNKHATQTSPNDSESNLSFRSSLDIVDSAYGSDRLQTMSVDLGQPSQQLHLPYAYPNNREHSHKDFTNKLSDESYTSAKSHQSETSKLKSLSKVSLSSSTSKVFQNHLYSLKKFFRYLPTRRSIENQKDGDTNHSDKQSMAESISQICLNRSQSPPKCPPPPGELKSMSYMKSSNVTYSNYDEFTRARNQQTSSLLNNNQARLSQQQSNKEDSNPDSLEELESWQLASLPVTYERNLATVFEEKQNSNDYFKNSDNNYQSIKPPENFEDRNHINPDIDKRHSAPSTSSSQSMTSITDADSILDFQRQAGTSFRFSYAQPRSFDQHINPQNNSGLPPRMPNNGETKQGTFSSSSSINSLVTNNCDHRGTIVNKSNQNGYSTINGYDNDADTTILSDTSTLNGDLNNLGYKCAELERTVNSLKNKLINKEKELTDLQLKQWSSDYLVDQLKSTIGRLEKENAQLKAVLENANRVNI